MTNEMIERVARALAKRHYEHRFGTSDQGYILMNVNGNWQIFSDDARAAIEAMREPTEGMTDHAWNADEVGLFGAKNVWQTMIDAALADPLPVFDRLTDDALGSREVEEK